MGFFSNLDLDRADDEPFSDEGWSIDDRRPGHLDAVPTFPASDLSIPLAADILTLVKERRDLAQLHEDAAGVRQLDRVRMNLLNGARLAWSFGDLLIQSVNTPGAVYSVNRVGCSCPNGVKGLSSCWHVALYDLLLDMQQTAADTADADAERDAGDPSTGSGQAPEPRRELGRTLVEGTDTVAEPVPELVEGVEAPPTPISISLSPSGVTLTHGADSYTAVGPHGLATLIRRLATPQALGARTSAGSVEPLAVARRQMI